MESSDSAPVKKGLLALLCQGVSQNFDAYKEVNTLETTRYQVAKNGPDGQPLTDAKGDAVMKDAKNGTPTLAGC